MVSSEQFLVLLLKKKSKKLAVISLYIILKGMMIARGIRSERGQPISFTTHTVIALSCYKGLFAFPSWCFACLLAYSSFVQT